MKKSNKKEKKKQSKQLLILVFMLNFVFNMIQVSSVRRLVGSITKDKLSYSRSKRLICF